MTCCAVIDTNVLVSALLSPTDDAATVQVFTRMLSGEILPVYSRTILEEYRTVSRRERFGFSSERVDALVDAIQKLGISVDPKHLDISLPDMTDVPFYEVVMEKRDEGAYLVTGNLRHFPKERFIVTPREMLEILNNQESYKGP